MDEEFDSIFRHTGDFVSQWTKKNPDRGFKVSARKHADIAENGLGFISKILLKQMKIISPDLSRNECMRYRGRM